MQFDAMILSAMVGSIKLNYEHPLIPLMQREMIIVSVSIKCSIVNTYQVHR